MKTSNDPGNAFLASASAVDSLPSDERFPPGHPRAPRKGFCLPCPACKESGGVRIYLDALGGYPADEATNELSCSLCDEEFSLASVRDFVAAWTPALAFLATAPVLVFGEE